MSSIAQKAEGLKCTTCGRLVPFGGRYCRACYTVVRDEKGTESVSASKLAVAFKCIVAVSIASSVVWLYQMDILLPQQGGVFKSDAESWKSLWRTSPDGSHRDGRRANSSRNASGQVQHKIPLKHAGRCTIRQAVQNQGTQPIGNVSLKVTFNDASGNFTGEGSRTKSIEPIRPGETRLLTLDLPCAEAAAAANVSVDQTNGGGQNNGKQGAVLLAESSGLRSHNAGRISAGSYTLVKDVADLSVCPPPGPCQITVRLNGRQTSTFAFRRADDDPELLISRDQLLVAHLLANKSDNLDAMSPQGELEFTLSYGDLVRTRDPNPFVQWFKGLFT